MIKKNVPPRIRQLPAAKQRRLDELLHKNSEGTITPTEKKRLRQLVSEAEQLMVENAKRLAEISTSDADAPSGAVPVTVWIRSEPAER